MTVWPEDALRIARSLRRHAFAAGLLTLPVLLITPLVASGAGFASPLAWIFLLTLALLSLAFAAHLLFDALLFRMAASHAGELTGLEAVDDVLARMGLRVRPDHVRPLPARITGSRRIVWMLWTVTGLCLVIFSICLIDMTV